MELRLRQRRKQEEKPQKKPREKPNSAVASPKDEKQDQWKLTQEKLKKELQQWKMGPI